MPELPEVEVTRRGIVPQMQGATITSVTVRNHRLRWPVPGNLGQLVTGLRIQAIRRRGKFILLECGTTALTGTVLVHLGMTGTLQIVPADRTLKPHDHVEFSTDHGILRYHDPRRFGAILWHSAQDGPIEAHPLLRSLGVEPLSPEFAGPEGGALLYRASRGKTVAVKQFLLAGHAVVGVGNIYASEALFRAGIDPRSSSGKISRRRYDLLATAIVEVLEQAIEHGGSTLRDFFGGDGLAGYAQRHHQVYDRAGEPCERCQAPIRWVRQNQRSTYFCPRCQKR